MQELFRDQSKGKPGPGGRWAPPGPDPHGPGPSPWAG
jgi:hypothetical protein